MPGFKLFAFYKQQVMRIIKANIGILSIIKPENAGNCVEI